MLKTIAVVIAAACFAVPALASGEGSSGESHANAVDHITCGDGTLLTPPFTNPVCAGHRDIVSVSCVNGAVYTPPLAGKSCEHPEGTTPPPNEGEHHDPPPPPTGDKPGSGDKPSGDGEDSPPLSSGFIHRVWKITGSANGYSDGVLDFTASKFIKIPKKYRDDDDSVVGEDSRVLVTSKTRVYDADHHRITGDDRNAALDDADTVIVIGKILPEAKWQQDEDGNPVPTIRAKRITITS